MATEKQQEKRGPGRPPKDSEQTKVNAVSNLQEKLDRLCAAMVDRPGNNFAAATARCARAGVPRATVEAAFEALDAALQDARIVCERAYENPKGAPIRPQSRVSLTP